MALVKLSNFVTAVPLNEPNSESSLPANTKRSGPISDTTYDNVASKNLMKMGFTQKKVKKKPINIGMNALMKGGLRKQCVK